MSILKRIFGKNKSSKKRNDGELSLNSRPKLAVKANQKELQKKLENLLHKKKSKGLLAKLPLISLKRENNIKDETPKLVENTNANFLDPNGKIKQRRRLKYITSTAVQSVFVLGLILGLSILGVSIINNSTQQAKASSNFFCPDSWTNLNNGQCVKAADSNIIYSCPDGGSLSGTNCIIPSNGPTGCNNGAVNPPTCDTVNLKPAVSTIIYNCPVGNLSQNLCSIQASIANCPNGAVNPPLCTVFGISSSSIIEQNSSSSLTQSSFTSLKQNYVDPDAKILSSTNASFTPATTTAKALDADLTIVFSNSTIPLGSTCDIQVRPSGDSVSSQDFSQSLLTNMNISYSGNCTATTPKTNQTSNRWEFLINIKTGTDKFFSLISYDFKPVPIPAGYLQ